MGIRWSWPRPSWTRRVSTAVPTTPRTGCGWAAPRASHATTAPTRTRTRCPRRCSCAHYVRMRGHVWRTRWTPGVVLSRDAGDVLAPGVTLATGVVRGAAGLPPRPRQEAQAGDSAGHLRPGAIVGAVWAGGDGTVRETARPRGVACAGCLAQPDRGPLGGAIGLDDLSGGGGHRGRLAAVLGKWAAPRFAGTAAIPALAADGKRIRGVNRHTNEDTHFETVTLVSHAGHPLASRCCRDEGGEGRRDPGAAGGCRCARLPDHPGRPATPPETTSGRSSRRTAPTICLPSRATARDVRGAHHLDWNAAAVRHHVAEPEQGHGRIDARRIDVQTLPPRTLAFDKAQQVFRVTRERTDLKTGETSEETAFGITSVPEDRADPERLLAWNRGHWQIENGNHYRRDVSLGEAPAASAPAMAPPTTPRSTTSCWPSFSIAASTMSRSQLHFMMRARKPSTPSSCRTEVPAGPPQACPSASRGIPATVKNGALTTGPTAYRKPARSPPVQPQKWPSPVRRAVADSALRFQHEITLHPGDSQRLRVPGSALPAKSTSTRHNHQFPRGNGYLAGGTATRWLPGNQGEISNWAI